MEQLTFHAPIFTIKKKEKKNRNQKFFNLNISLAKAKEIPLQSATNISRDIKQIHRDFKFKSQPMTQNERERERNAAPENTKFINDEE